MRIDNQGARGVNRAPGAGASAGPAPAGPAGAPAAEPVENSHIPSPELQSLLAAVAHLPAVRADVVAGVSARLASGDLSNGEAAQHTAAAMLAAATSPEASGVAALLQQSPEVRPGAVAAASDKLARGELSTPEAIERTAEAMLG